MREDLLSQRETIISLPKPWDLTGMNARCQKILI